MPITKREAKEIVDWVVSELHRKGFLYLTDGKVDLSKVRVGTISGTASVGGRIADGAIWNRHVAEDADIRGTKVRIATTSERGTAQFATSLEIISQKAVQADSARLHNTTVANATEHDARYYTEAELNAGQLDNRYFTEVELGGQWGADLIGISNPSGYWIGNKVQTALDELYKRKFKSLSDVPNDYVGYAGNVVAVRATEDGLEFVVPSGGGASTFLDLTDTPNSYAGQQGKAVVVNATEDGVEFVLISGATTSGGGSDFNPDRMFSFVPEFPNAILFADGVTNSGTLILDYDEGHNFYDWTTLEAMAQDYDVYLKFLIPPDLNTMGSGIYIWNKSDPSVNTGVRLVEFLDSLGANLITDSLVQSSAWTESFWEMSGGTWYVNTLATMHFKMQSDPYYHARIGEVRLPYVVKQIATQVFSFVPEFDGFITEAVTGTNTGTMTGVYDSGHNGFKWTNTEVLTQDYDVVVRFRIPPNFTAMGGTLYMYNKVSSTFGSTGVRLVELLDTNGVNVITPLTNKNATWTESTYAIGASTWETGKLATLRFRLFADIGESAYLGEVRITYTTD